MARNAGKAQIGVWGVLHKLICVLGDIAIAPFVLVALLIILLAGCSSGASPARTVITPGTAESTFTTTEDRGRTVLVRTPPSPSQPTCPAPRPAEPRVIVRVVPVGPDPG